MWEGASFLQTDSSENDGQTFAAQLEEISQNPGELLRDQSWGCWICVQIVLSSANAKAVSLDLKAKGGKDRVYQFQGRDLI